MGRNYTSIFLFNLIMFLSAYTFSGESKTKIMVFKAVHGPYEVISKPLNLFKEEVERKTDGRVKVELIIPESQSATNQAAVIQTLDDVKSGKIQMSQLYSGYMAKFEKDFQALELPFIFKDHNHAFSVVDGEIGKNLLAKLQSQSPLKGLGYTYCGGYRIIASNTVKLKTVEDFKGLKINVGSSMSQSIMKELGVNVVGSVSKENIGEGLQKKNIDAYDTVFPRYYHGDEFKTARYANDVAFNIQFTILVINKKFFLGLSKKDQEIVEIAAQKASLLERKMAIEIADDVKINASKYGIELVSMSDSEKNKLIEKLEQVDWSKKQKISAEIIRKIKSLEPKSISTK